MSHDDIQVIIFTVALIAFYRIGRWIGYKQRRIDELKEKGKD
jgi:hypothetical protein